MTRPKGMETTARSGRHGQGWESAGGRVPGAALRSCRCQSTLYLRPTLRRQLHGSSDPYSSTQRKGAPSQTCHPCRQTRPATPATLGTSPRARLSSHCLPRSAVTPGSKTKDSRAELAVSLLRPPAPACFFTPKAYSCPVGCTSVGGRATGPSRRSDGIGPAFG